jgi:hypothetical protein
MDRFEEEMLAIEKGTHVCIFALSVVLASFALAVIVLYIMI